MPLRAKPESRTHLQTGVGEQIHYTQRDLYQSLGREPTSTEIANQLDIDEKVENLSSLKEPMSLDTIGEDSASTFGSFIEDDSMPSPESVLDLTHASRFLQRWQNFPKRREGAKNALWNR